MTPHHQKILSELKKKPTKKGNVFFSKNYTGSEHKAYSVSAPDLRSILKKWLKNNSDLKTIDIFDTVSSLMLGKSHEEKMMGAYLLGYRKDVRKITKTHHLDKWLDGLVGWAEIDALCQNIFSAEEVLLNWKSWKPFLIELSKSNNINKRRASLVFLVGPTWKSDNIKFHNLAIKNIEKLQAEKDILITKAISWLLRCMIITRRKETEEYLESNSESLPKIAVRETRNKISNSRPS